MLTKQNNPTTLKLKDSEGRISSIRVSLKYIPIKMKLDPSESINNMGTLRVDILDAKDLPSADRNGYSDPFCKFELNGKDVFKTQVQKKTLTPAWNEFFETEIPSRTAAKFVCKVYDWDFASDPDFLGAAVINLDLLDPFLPQEYNLNLDGKSGSIRLRALFRPAYVQRSRQGSSTFSGTFAVPGKVVTGVVGAPVKGVGLAAHGVGKGASFIRHGFRTKSKEGNGTSFPVDESAEAGGTPTLRRATGLADNDSSPVASRPGTALSGSPSHARTTSVGSAYTTGATGSAAPSGTATFTIASATGYPPSSNVMVYIKQLSNKKTLHKTKHIKSSTGTVTFEKETFTTKCSADTQFQVQVKSHSTFGSDDDLGESVFFVDESGAGLEKSVKAGSGTVMIKSTFALASTENGSGADSLKVPNSGGMRRSFLSKKENGRASRDGTPSSIT